MTAPLTHGAQLAAADPGERFAIHAGARRREEFSEYDAALSRILEQAIRGELQIEVEFATRRTKRDRVTIQGIDEKERAQLAQILNRARHEERGAWYLPEEARPAVGQIEFARWMATEPRFAASAAEARKPSIALETPDELLIWSALEPLMADLYLPVKLRSGNQLGNRKPTLMAKDWARVDETYAALGIEAEVLSLFKDGRRWARLRGAEITEAKQALTSAWAQAPNVGERAVCLLISRITERYYKKAKDGRAERVKVMNTDVERLLTATFGGDWLAYLRYLGEGPHPNEQVATTVEPTTLIVSPEERAEQAAVATGVSIDDIHRLISAYWGGEEESPVQRRVQVMRQWWRAFDQIHAAQAPGKPSLWGLLGDRFAEDSRPWLEQDGRYTPRAYEVLPSGLVDQVEKLWGTVVLPRWPEAMVSEPYPHAAFADALGPAAAFWHEAALTCWFICEGPFSRTTIGAMPNYYEEQIQAMADLGCPIDFAMMAELREAEGKLTPRPPDPGQTSEHDIGGGLSLEVTVSVGPEKKDGFEHLNAVLTRYRRAWMDEHLERYLQAVWEQDLRGLGDAYHRQVADKGKPPTVKQFAKLAHEPVNRWFAGDLAQTAAALGLPAPDPQEYRRLLPADLPGFVQAVRRNLGGKRWEQLPDDIGDDERERLRSRSQLAEHAPKVVQVWEATGERPSLKGFSWARSLLQAGFGDDLEAAWSRYITGIEQGLRQPPESADPNSGTATEKPEPPTTVPHGDRGEERGIGRFFQRFRRIE